MNFSYTYAPKEGANDRPKSDSTLAQLGKPVSVPGLRTEHGQGVTYRSVGDSKSCFTNRALPSMDPDFPTAE